MSPRSVRSSSTASSPTIWSTGSSLLDDEPDPDGRIAGLVAIAVRRGRVERDRVARLEHDLVETQCQQQVSRDEIAVFPSLVAHQLAGARRGAAWGVGDLQEVHVEWGQ